MLPDAVVHADHPELAAVVIHGEALALSRQLAPAARTFALPDGVVHTDDVRGPLERADVLGANSRGRFGPLLGGSGVGEGAAAVGDDPDLARRAIDGDALAERAARHLEPAVGFALPESLPRPITNGLEPVTEATVAFPPGSTSSRTPRSGSLSLVVRTLLLFATVHRLPLSLIAKWRSFARRAGRRHGPTVRSRSSARDTRARSA